MPPAAFGLPHAGDHRLDHPPPARAHDVADHRVELDVGLCRASSGSAAHAASARAPAACGCASARAAPESPRSGTKLALISPQANRSAIHIASFMSVLRPGTFLMCAALATINSNSPVAQDACTPASNRRRSLPSPRACIGIPRATLSRATSCSVVSRTFGTPASSCRQPHSARRPPPSPCAHQGRQRART